MKKLLSTLSVVIIGASSSSLFANNVASSKEIGTLDQEQYWNSDHKVEICQVKSKGKIIGQNPAMNLVLYTFNLGTSQDFTHFNFLDSAVGNVKWGSKEYGQWNIQSFDFAYDQEHNYHLKDINDENFFPCLKYKLFDKTYTVVFASLIARTHLGYTWYQEANQYYFQFLVFEYVNTRNSHNGGTNEINLGRGVIFS